MKTTNILLLVLFLYSGAVMSQTEGYSITFNGVNQYADLGAVNAFNFAESPFTIELWFRTTATNQLQTLFGKDGYCFHNGYYLRIEDTGPHANTLRGVVSAIMVTDCDNTSKAVDIFGSTVVTDGRWHHAAMVVDRPGGSLSVTIYLDGKLEAMGTNSNVNSADYIGNGEHLGMGAIHYYADSGESCFETGGCWGGYFNGTLDEMRVWNTARSANQVNSNMFKKLTVQTGLVASYRMSIGTGDMLPDDSGNLPGGTLVNAPEWKSSGCFAGPVKALEFDGNSNYIEVPSSSSLNISTSGALTIEAWVNPSAVANNDWNNIVMKGSYGYGFALAGTTGCSGLAVNKLVFWDQNSCGSCVFSNISYTSGVWQHVAVSVYDYGNGLTLYFYINGIQDGPYYSNQPNIYNGGDNSALYIGRQGASCACNYFKGKMDELRIWNTNRSESQIRDNMMRNLEGSESGLQAYYRFDQGDPTTLFDQTINANNGTYFYMNHSVAWITSEAFNFWIGSESSNWTTALNWSTGSVPVSGENVGLYKWDAPGFECSISGTPVLKSLIISSSSNPVLASAMTVNDKLFLENDFNLNGQAITLGSSGLLGEGSHRLFGTSGTITTTRILNNINALNVGGLGAELTTAANMGSTVITRGHAQQSGNTGSSIFRYYDITPSNNSGLNATFVFRYNSEEKNGGGTFQAYRSTDAGQNWFNMGGYDDYMHWFLTLDSVNSFSRWTLSDTYLSCSNPVSGGTIGSAQSVCEGLIPSPIIELTAPTGYTGTDPLYRWFSATIPQLQYFVEIQGNTSSSYSPGAVTTSTWFMRQTRVACKTDWTNAPFSNMVEVALTQPYTPGTFHVSDLQASGQNIKWYAAASGGSPLAPTTILVNGARYYASQTVNSVESLSRLGVTATIDQTPCKPTGPSSQTKATGATVASLEATGSGIRWYAAASGGTALPASTLLVDGTHYFASQTVSCTESASRLEVTVTVTP